MLVKHQDGEVERGEFSDTFVRKDGGSERKELKRKGRLNVKERTTVDTCRMGMLGLRVSRGLHYSPPGFLFLGVEELHSREISHKGSRMKSVDGDIPGGLISVATAKALKRRWPSVFITGSVDARTVAEEMWSNDVHYISNSFA